MHQNNLRTYKVLQQQYKTSQTPPQEEGKVTLEKTKPSAQIKSDEVGDYVDNEAGSKEIIEYLIDRNYQPYEFQKGKILPHKIKDKYEYDNLLIIHQK